MKEKVCKLLGHKIEVIDSSFYEVCVRCGTNSYDDLNMYITDWHYFPFRWWIKLSRRIEYWRYNRSHNYVNEDEIPF